MPKLEQYCPAVFKNGKYFPEAVTECAASGRYVREVQWNSKLPVYPRVLSDRMSRVTVGTTFVATAGSNVKFELVDPFGGFSLKSDGCASGIFSVIKKARPDCVLRFEGNDYIDWGTFCQDNWDSDASRIDFEAQGAKIKMRFINHFESDEQALRHPYGSLMLVTDVDHVPRRSVHCGYGLLVRMEESDGTLWHLWTANVDIGHKWIVEDIEGLFGDKVELVSTFAESRTNPLYSAAENATYKACDNDDSLEVPHDSVSLDKWKYRNDNLAACSVNRRMFVRGVKAPVIFKSRHTPGQENGADIGFCKGEVVECVTKDGSRKTATIDSELRSHSEAGGDHTGYECEFLDGSPRGFVPRCKIVDWKDKC